MEGYWWRCTSCGFEVQDVPVPGCIRKEMIECEWDQSKLTRACPKCKIPVGMRITYEFPNNPVGTVQVIHIVGLYDPDDAEYVSMLWETVALANPSEPMFQFNYMRGSNPKGLRTVPVLSLDGIGTMLELYQQRTGKSLPFKIVRESAQSA